MDEEENDEKSEINVTHRIMKQIQFFSLRFQNPVLAADFEEYLFKKNEAVVRSNAVYIISPFLNVIGALTLGAGFFADASGGYYVKSVHLGVAGLLCF